MGNGEFLAKPRDRLWGSLQPGGEVRIVLECIPISKTLDEIQRHFEDLIKDIQPKAKVVKIRIERERRAKSPS